MINHKFHAQADDDAVCCCGQSKYYHPAEMCTVCGGTGANPLSDIRNWISCSDCGGNGINKDGPTIGEVALAKANSNV